MQVRELITRLGFNADTQQARKYDNALASVRRIAMVATTAVAALGAAATTLVSSFVQSSSETLSWARRLGIATDELQRLQFAASRYNVTNDALIDGLKEASLRADEFIKTGAGGGAEAFERLGLSGEELNRVSGDTAQLFELIQRRIQEVDNVAARQRIADEIFGGQAGEQFTEFLAAGRDETERMGRLAETMGAIVPERALERARELGQEFNTLKAAFKGIGASVASELLPVFRDIVDTTLEWLAANRKWITSGFVRSLSWLRVTLSGVWSVVRKFTDAIDMAVENTLGWNTTLKTIRTILLTLLGYKLATWAWGIAKAIRGVVAAVGLLRAGLIALQRIGILAIFTGIALALEDIYNWINDNDSLIGQWLGSWKNFKNRISDWIDDIVEKIEEFIEKVKEIGRTVIELPGNMIRRFFGLPEQDQRSESEYLERQGLIRSQSEQSSSRKINVNARTEAVLQVPPGTSEEQRQALSLQSEEMFRQHWDRELRRALWDFQPVE